MRQKTVNNSTPYDLFRDGAAFRQFCKRCASCRWCDPDPHGQPQCEIFDILYHSILDKDLRWEDKYMKIEKGVPVCQAHEEK